MAEPFLRQLKSLSSRCGLQPRYQDSGGFRRDVSAESMLAVLKAMGLDVHDGNVDQILAELDAADARRGLPPCIVMKYRPQKEVLLRLSTPLPIGKVRCRLMDESGQEQQQEHDLASLPTRPAASSLKSDDVEVSIPLPGVPKIGYHQLIIETSGRRWETMLIRAPAHIFTPADEEARCWGGFLPLYALRTARNWGAGDYTDLEGFQQWIGGYGGRVAATLPLMPAFLDDPYDPSPYAPISRQFWNEFYIDIHRIPELQGCPAAQELAAAPETLAEITELRATEFVEYRRLMALKRRVLETLAAWFFQQDIPRRADFQRYLDAHPTVKNYASFRAASERHGSPWQNWPERMQQGKWEPGDFDEAARQSHLYAQWIASEQVQEVSRNLRAAGGGLYLDLPVGVRRDGFDVWQNPRLFVQSINTGAPPDLLFTRGQDWGFPPLNPLVLRETGYAHFITYIRHHLQLARWLRIDHVMGLHRLWWVPAGMGATNGVYVQYEPDEMYAILKIESHRSQSRIFGENLGTVPPPVNKMMDKTRLGRMHVVQYELQTEPPKELEPAPHGCVATLNTHDMPPFASYWRGDDIDDRVDLGLHTPEEAVAEQGKRAAQREVLLAQVRREHLTAAGDTSAVDAAMAAQEHLAEGPAELVLINVEDLWQEQHPQNVPGTLHERPNWRRKARYPLEQWSELPGVKEALDRVARHRKPGPGQTP